MKYRPLDEPVPPVVSLQSEWFYRRREMPDEVLQDFGGYAQALYRFAERWSIAARYEYGSPAYGDGGDVVEDPLDPEWSQVRRRYAANVTFYPTEFSRLRLQGNRDVPGRQRRLLGSLPRRRSGDWRARRAPVLRSTPCAISYDFWVLSLLLLAGVLFAPRAHAELRVVTTTPDLAAITQALSAGRAKVTSLALPSQDPHFVDARPRLALELSKADLLILVGADLELGWLPTLVTGSRNADPEWSQRATSTRRRWSRCSGAGGQGRPQPGRHSPSREPSLSARPAPRREGRGWHRQEARGARSRGTRGLPRSDQSVRDLAPGGASRDREEARTPARSPIVGYHRSLAYLADWLGLVVIDHLEPKPGIPAEPAPRGAGGRPGQARKSLACSGVVVAYEHLGAGSREDRSAVGRDPRHDELPVGSDVHGLPRCRRGQAGEGAVSLGPLLETRSLSIGHRGQPLLPAFDLSVGRGDFWAVIGRNGSGKTTWLKTLLGLMTPVSGEIVRSPALKLAYLPQRGAADDLYPVTARDVVAMGCQRGFGFFRSARLRRESGARARSHGRELARRSFLQGALRGPTAARAFSRASPLPPRT